MSATTYDRVIRLSETSGMLRLIASKHLLVNDAYYAVVSGARVKVVRDDATEEVQS